MGQTGLFFVYFRSFQTNIVTIFTKNKCDKCPFSIQCLDSNSQPSDYKSPPLTTRPGLPPILQSLNLTIKWFSISFYGVRQQCDQKWRFLKVFGCKVCYQNTRNICQHSGLLRKASHFKLKLLWQLFGQLLQKFGKFCSNIWSHWSAWTSIENKDSLQGKKKIASLMEVTHRYLKNLVSCRIRQAGWPFWKSC